MARLPALLLTLTFITCMHAADPRIVDRSSENAPIRRADANGNANEIELMECGGRLSSLPSIRVNQPNSDTSTESFNEQDLALLRQLDDLDPDLPGPSSPRQQAIVQQQRQQDRLDELRWQQQQDAALTIPPDLQNMSQEIGPAAPPSTPVEAPYGVPSNGTSPPLATGTSTVIQNQCLRCFNSCIGCIGNQERALSDYCNAGQGRCACGEQGWDCALDSASCCAIFGTITGTMALLGLYASENSP